MKHTEEKLVIKNSFPFVLRRMTLIDDNFFFTDTGTTGLVLDLS